MTIVGFIRHASEPHRDWLVTSGASSTICEPVASRATEAAAGAGEVQASDELGFGRAGHA
jgi:hypothetical protein